MRARPEVPRVATVVAVLVVVAVAVVAPSLVGERSVTDEGCPVEGTSVGAPVQLADPTPGVAEYRYTFVDRTRSTPALGDRPASGCRVLTTLVRIPRAATGPVPMILAVHGRDGDPAALAPLLDGWARAGYVVIAPHFLVTRKAANGKALSSEIVEQAADARFVLDAVIDRSEARGSPLDGRVDREEIGVAGMSLGGQTVYGLVSHQCCRDGRIGAAVVMAGVHDAFPDADYGHNDAPVFLVQGDADVGYHHSVDAYRDLDPPKWFLTLHDERHSPPFEVPRDASSVIVDQTTLSFWDRYLRDQIAAAAQIVAAANAAGDAVTLVYEAR